MTKTVDNYSAFNKVNLSNARGENESFEDYKIRQKQNKQILKIYSQMGRDNFKLMFPEGVGEAIKASIEESIKETEQIPCSASLDLEMQGESE